MTNQEFNETIWDYYAHHGRHDLPWRAADINGQFDPYKIVVSELMLQQTQVQRVIPKFNEFLMTFPSVDSLAKASLADVLGMWSGLGYNRRAKFLWQTAAAVVNDYNGQFPSTASQLVSLPGIGKNTAGAVLAYAYNQPAPFIETNVRTVYIHHFFHDYSEVSDAQILEKLNETLPTEQPREFYWALMDYGSYLKQTVGNLSRLSTTYSKQSKFEGSRRQIRGQVLKTLSSKGYSLPELQELITDQRLESVLSDLLNEGLITVTAGTYRL